MNRAVDSDVGQDTSTERDVDTAARDQTAVRQHPASAKVSQDPGPPPSGMSNYQLVVGDIPQEPPGFQPPTDLLADLDRAGPGVSVAHAVNGLQGVGKTQLAAAYAREKLAEGWRLVAWVNAEDNGSLLAGLAAVADCAGLSGGDSRDAAQAVRHWLEADGERCLLVFDDVEDPSVLRPFVPGGGQARVLITTTRQSVTDLGFNVPVEAFSADEAREFLDECTGLGDEAEAAAVAAELGYLPLALAQAAAVMAGQQLGYEAYLRRLRALSAEGYLTEAVEQPYPPAALAALLLSLDAAKASDQTGMNAGVMEIMAVLSAAGVRRELLHAAGQAGALVGRHRVAAAVVDRALELLADRSLLTFSLDGQTVIVHRMVARVMREELARRGRLTAVCRAVASVLEARAEALTRSHDRTAIRDFPQQVTALDSIRGTAADADQQLAGVLLRLRFLALYHLIERGESAPQAIAVGKPLTADLELVLSRDHPDTLNSRNSLAAAYLAAGRVDEALPLFEQTLVGRERVLGPDHPDTLNSQNNLAATYQDVGRTGEAILLFKLTLAARERLLGPDHPSTVNSRGNLAAAYLAAGRVDEAIPLFEQTLIDRERVLGPGHSDTLLSRYNLASAYRDAGRAAEAIPLMKRTLADRERLLGAEHPDTLSVRYNLAAAYHAAGRAAEAIPFMKQTLAAHERLGTDDAKTLVVRNNLAAAYLEVGRIVDAIPLFEQTLADRERLLGADHPSTLASRNNLANAYRKAGRTDEAIFLHEQTLATCERLLGADDRKTLASRNNLASAYGDAGRADEAIPLFEQTLADRERLLGADHPDTLTTRNNLALAYQQAGRSADATVSFRAVGEPGEAARESAEATMAFRAVGEPASATDDLAHVNGDTGKPTLDPDLFPSSPG